MRARPKESEKIRQLVLPMCGFRPCDSEKLSRSGVAYILKCCHVTSASGSVSRSQLLSASINRSMVAIVAEDCMSGAFVLRIPITIAIPMPTAKNASHRRDWRGNPRSRLLALVDDCLRKAGVDLCNSRNCGETLHNGPCLLPFPCQPSGEDAGGVGQSNPASLS